MFTKAERILIFGSSKVPEIGILVAKRFLGWLRNSLETPATTLSQRQLQWVFPCIPEINNRNIVKDGFDVASQLSGGERYSQGDQKCQDNEGHLRCRAKIAKSTSKRLLVAPRVGVPDPAFNRRLRASEDSNFFDDPPAR